MTKISDPTEVLNAREAYFVGIGGTGMSSLARILHSSGLHVSGSDVKQSRVTLELQAAGIPVFIGQEQPRFDPDVDFLVYSSAISNSHIELQAAQKSGKRILHRAAVLSSLFNSAPTSIAVTGTHGKTTTSSMISYVLKELGKDPTCMVGGELMDFGTNALIGRSGIYVSEVDESDRTHELFNPNYAVITNLEEEHVDQYENSSQLHDSFRKFLENCHDPGMVIYSDDDVVLRQLVHESSVPHASFGFSTGADFNAQNISLTAQGSTFDLYECGIFACQVKLCLIGLHNVMNALACFALLVNLGISPEEIAQELQHFHGAKRRLEVKFHSEEATIITDYAHNPTKVRAAVKALKVFNQPVTVVFQPHRFTRTARFFKEFAVALREADRIVVTDIYGSGERNDHAISSELICKELVDLGHSQLKYISRADLVNGVLLLPELNGVIAFLGAGDIGEAANEFTDRFRTHP